VDGYSSIPVNVGIQAAAEGRPEIAFWPAAAMALFLSEHGRYVNIIFLMILLLTGGINYTLLKYFRKAVKQSQESTRTRVRNSRADSPEIEDRIRSATGAIEHVFPNNLISMLIVVICFVVNLIFSIYLFGIYAVRIIYTPNPDLTVIGVFVAPVIYASIIFSIVIWRL